MILTSMAASFIIAATPELALADVGTPDYDPVFYYYHSDHLGSSEVMTDRDGDPVQHYGYQPFGNERYKHNTHAFSVTNRYTGQQLDEDTGLYFYGSRYYDPALARFIQPDSMVPGSGSQALNRYSYCFNNPLIFTDPTGNLPFLVIVAISAAINAGIAAAQGARGIDIWKAAAAGAIAGAFGYLGGGLSPVGIACSAAGGALGALVTGGDPAIAAATAGIGAGISIACGYTPLSDWVNGTLSQSELFMRQLYASTGIGALAGGVSSVAFSGDFWEGAMWGAAGAATSFIITNYLQDLFPEQNLGHISGKAYVEYKTVDSKGNDHTYFEKWYCDLSDVNHEDPFEVMLDKVIVNNEKIYYFKSISHGFEGDIFYGKSLGSSDIHAYSDKIKLAFSESAHISIEACYSADLNVSNPIVRTFKHVLPKSSVYGYTGEAKMTWNIKHAIEHFNLQGGYGSRPKGASVRIEWCECPPSKRK